MLALVNFADTCVQIIALHSGVRQQPFDLPVASGQSSAIVSRLRGSYRLMDVRPALPEGELAPAEEPAPGPRPHRCNARVEDFLQACPSRRHPTWFATYS